MYYEEKIIAGVKMFRAAPSGEWCFLKKDLATVIGNIILNG
jgi:hypothetical protein